MSQYLCHETPDLFEVDTEVVKAEPGRVLLARSSFYPGGGGQPADRGVLEWSGGATAITGIEVRGGQMWHLLADQITPSGAVSAMVDPVFRAQMCRLHTALHIANALVFEEFDGALVTGVQMSDNATARIDFDLPGADNERLRALEPAINDVVRQDLPVRTLLMPLSEAAQEEGTLRSKAVTPPPQTDGRVRIVEIEGLDRQACGGTHLTSTGQAGELKILKVENKGRHNRRLRLGLIELSL
ncbi:alanyl-tRNA editing protein [Denitrobaculum tricleocarpae]|uniref:Alanine--tRNA ligase n=1 Tax=Denitrobaculum tricleocarpae TaxID=2591009 RepID=A0A545TUM2_9PROT|nr:alanyl-tRNA editing protein [Denitrobaculum tricleocarpae]TQV80912.1 alanyl-tRNA editing protein [Denitrobaculum tricleocarpae]